MKVPTFALKASSVPVAPVQTLKMATPARHLTHGAHACSPFTVQIRGLAEQVSKHASWNLQQLVEWHTKWKTVSKAMGAQGWSGCANLRARDAGETQAGGRVTFGSGHQPAGKGYAAVPASKC